MGLVNLNVYPRTTTGKNENRRTRAAGRIPAVLYGHDREPVNVCLDTREFGLIMMKLRGRSVIFNLKQEGVEDGSIALMRELQQHPVSDEILHVDLFEIPRGVPVNVEVPILLEGTPQLVKFGEADLIQTLYSVEISCLPRELPEGVTGDIAELEMNQSLYVKDLTAPAGEIVTDGETQVCVVKPATVFSLDEEGAEGAEGEAAEGAEGEDGGAETPAGDGKDEG